MGMRPAGWAEAMQKGEKRQQKGVAPQMSETKLIFIELWPELYQLEVRRSQPIYKMFFLPLK